MQVPAGEAWRGVVLCTENARRLFDGARLLAERELYGQAASLMVLSAEESAKAVGMISFSIQPAELKLSLKPYFRDHSFKHGLAGYFIAFTSFMDDMMNRIVDIEQDPAVSEADYTKELLGRMTSRLEEHLSDGDDPFQDVKAWQREADSVKQRGFYVDFQEGAWRSPDDLGVDTYKVMWKKAADLLRMLELVVAHADPDELRDEMAKRTAHSASTSVEPTR